jgi:hypothetical protein
MKKQLYLPLFILLALSITSCQSSGTSNLQATNDALSNQVNMLSTQVAQQASAPTQSAPVPVNPTAENILPTSPPLASPTPLPTTEGGITPIAPTMIVSGSGLITLWKNDTYYTKGIFGTANVHLVCNQNNPADGEIWIDKENYKITCNPGGDSWTLWKQDITIGNHYIYSKYANDKYEFWTIGTTPFTVRNKHDSTDFMFQINDAGEYQLSANLIAGAFNVYITCQGAQNFNYKITQSTSIPLVLNPAMCQLIVRDDPAGTVNPGEIEVSLVKK